MKKKEIEFTLKSSHPYAFSTTPYQQSKPKRKQQKRQRIDHQQLKKEKRVNELKILFLFPFQ